MRLLDKPCTIKDVNFIVAIASLTDDPIPALLNASAQKHDTRRSTLVYYHRRVKRFLSVFGHETGGLRVSLAYQDDKASATPPMPCPDQKPTGKFRGMCLCFDQQTGAFVLVFLSFLVSLTSLLRLFLRLMVRWATYSSGWVQARSRASIGVSA